MNRRDKSINPGPDFVWSEKHQLWADVDDRTPERKLEDECIVLRAENEQIDEIIHDLAWCDIHICGPAESCPDCVKKVKVRLLGSAIDQLRAEVERLQIAVHERAEEFGEMVSALKVTNLQISELKAAMCETCKCQLEHEPGCQCTNDE